MGRRPVQQRLGQLCGFPVEWVVVERRQASLCSVQPHERRRFCPNVVHGMQLAVVTIP